MVLVIGELDALAALNLLGKLLLLLLFLLLAKQLVIARAIHGTRTRATWSALAVTVVAAIAPAAAKPALTTRIARGGATTTAATTAVPTAATTAAAHTAIPTAAAATAATATCAHMCHNRPHLGPLSLELAGLVRAVASCVHNAPTSHGDTSEPLHNIRASLQH